MAWCRFLTFRGENLNWQKTENDHEYLRKNCGINMPYQSIDNESKSWKLILETAEKAYSEYPDTLEKDIEFLKRAKLSINQKNCIMFRKSEKEILVFLIDCSKLMITLFDHLSLANLTGETIKQHLEGFPYFDEVVLYIQEFIFPIIPDSEKYSFEKLNLFKN